jgi:iron complex outermembrane receptor protein
VAGTRTFAEIAPVTSNTREEKPVSLSPFEVRESSTDNGRYSWLESTSAGRVHTDIMDSSQSISVITEEMIEDIAPGRIVEVAQYVAGISDSTLPTSWERTNIRGFQSDGRTVDGITYGGTSVTYGFQNMDPAIIERIEIVKGPNSILAPQPTSPGGTINSITRKPHFRDFGVINLRWGRFDANSGFLDVNRVVSNKLAVRLVGSERDWDNWWKSSHVHSTTLMPSLTYRFSANAQATVQYVYTNWKASNYFGLPIDPTSSSTTPARILTGVSRDLDIYPDDLFRTTRQHELKLFFTARLWRGIQMRLAAAYNTNTAHLTQLTIGPKDGNRGSYDPLTGLWHYGVSYALTPPYAPTPIAPPPSRIFLREGVEQFFDPRQRNLQNDYAYIVENSFLRSAAVAGFAYRDVRTASRTNNLRAAEFDIDHYVDAPLIRSSTGSLSRGKNSFRQVYFSENLALFRNRLILNAAGSWQTYHVTRNAHKQVNSFGAVIKPAGEAVSLYSSYIETNVDPTAARPSSAQQKEFGARIKMWDARLYLDVSHFDITQDNFGVANPAALLVPRPPNSLGTIYSDRRARGWEYELRSHPTKSLSIIGSYTHFKNRDQNNVEYRGVAEGAGGVFASYTFEKENLPTLAGMRVAVGVNYVGNRPGDTPTPVTIVTPIHVIPAQPSFYLGARTLVNLTLAYDSKHRWGVQVNVDNVFDTEYLWASGQRSSVFPGTPRNIRVSLKYRF